MSMNKKLVDMINQIARNTAIQGDERAIAATADHVRKFWDPRMRAGLMAHLADGGAGLDDIARAASMQLAASNAPEIHNTD